MQQCFSGRASRSFHHDRAPMQQLRVIVVDAPRDAAYYARLEESLADPTIMGNLLGATAIKTGWKYASIRRTEHGDFILWQGAPDPSGIGNSRKLVKSLLQRARLPTNADVRMLDTEGMVDMELHFEAHKADAAAPQRDSASGSSGDVVTKAFALDGAPRVVSDLSRAIASKLVDDSKKQDAGNSDLGAYTGSGNLALDDAAPGAGSLALVVAPADEFRMQQLVTTHAGDTRDPFDPAMSEARDALAQHVVPKQQDDDGVYREGLECERSHNQRVACVERRLLHLTLDKQAARERAELAAEKEMLRLLWAYSSPDWDGVLRMKRPERMKEEAWKTGLRRQVEAAVASGETPTFQEGVDLAREDVSEGLLSHVNDTAPLGRKKAELQNRSNKVYRRVMLGREDDDDDDDDNENPPATQRNRKGRCGMCNYMTPAIKASILFGAETELFDADACAAADKARQDLAGLEQRLRDGPSESKRRHLGEQIRGLTTLVRDVTDAAIRRHAALRVEYDKAMKDMMRSEPANHEEHVQKIANMKRAKADYEQKVKDSKDDDDEATVVPTKKKIDALKEQQEGVKDEEGEERLRNQIEDLTPVALGPFWADVEKLKRRGLALYVGDYPAVELARFTAPICKHALFCSENCLIKWRVAKMCPNCGDTSRLGRKELKEDEARKLGVNEGVPDVEENETIAMIARLSKCHQEGGRLNDELHAKIKHECGRLAEIHQPMKRVWKCRRCSTQRKAVLVCSRDPKVWLPDQSYETPHEQGTHTR